jgi:hypothetical protein
VNRRASGLFAPAHLEVIHRAIADDAAYGLLVDALPRLEAIIRSARGKGCTFFRCTLRERDFRVALRFKGNEGQRLAASFSFRRNYERNGKLLSRETALAFRLAIESLVVIAGRFTLMK